MKDYESVSREVYDLISKTLSVDSSTFATESPITDLSEDSIQLFELLLAFERYYEIEAVYDDVVRLNTVGDIVSYIAEKKYALARQVS